MTKKIQLLAILIIGFILIPLNVKADSYNTLDLREALADEEIEESFEKYSPNSDAITIYLFRGKGCGFCRAYLQFMDSIAEEYGKYFKLQSYEVWNDSKNAELLDKVADYLNEPAGGVPYIVIGDKVFGGYISDYDEDIKQAIMDLYETPKKKRYDVLEQMEKNPKKTETTVSSDSNKTIVWAFALTVVATFIVVSYTSIKFKELNLELAKIKDASANKSAVVSTKTKPANKKTTNKKK